MQARYSYQPSDILWGHRFENLIYFDKSSDNYVIDFRQFNKTKEVRTLRFNIMMITQNNEISYILYPFNIKFYIRIGLFILANYSIIFLFRLNLITSSTNKKLKFQLIPSNINYSTLILQFNLVWR